MYMDSQNKFSDGQAITASAVSLKTIDQGAKGDAYENLWLVVRSKVSLDSANHTATLQVKVQTADAVDGNNVLTGTVYDLGISPVRVVAALVAGSVIWKAEMPRGSRRYIALSYVVGTENFNAGSVDAFLTKDPELVGQTLRSGAGVE
ncbi:MAG: hypothetical protein HY079_06330 [Elusimicrobia bacterium]|nr:hypothetical protein [Elusimicrobiota bacterium]